MNEATYNKLVFEGASWHPDTVVSKEYLKRFKHNYWNRVRMVQAVDDLIAEVRTMLESKGIADDTYVVFGSDNGYHAGDRGLLGGKNTAYDHDVRLPLIVVPPGGAAPTTIDQLVSQIDLLPTFAEIGGFVPPFQEPIDGMSILGMINGGQEPWRQTALIQFVRDAQQKGNPDRVRGADAQVPTFKALRTSDYLYVDYGTLDDVPPVDHDTGEYFDLSADPNQMINIYDDLPASRRAALNDLVLEYAGCSGEQCWSAGLIVA